MLTVLFFGRLQDAAGCDGMSVDGSVGNIMDLLVYLEQNDPALADILRDDKVKIAVNGAIIDGRAVLRPGDEIAFLPPVSGG